MESKGEVPRRRWYQFSLRTLLILMTLCAIPLSWLGWKLEQGRRERAVIAWVERSGGVVYWNWKDESDWRYLPPASRFQEYPTRWFGPNVLAVYFYDTEVPNLSPLTRSRSVKCLGLRVGELGDLSPLTKLENLESLHLIDIRTTDLSPLAKLTNLKELDLHGPGVTYRQVRELAKKLPNCQIWYVISDQ